VLGRLHDEGFRVTIPGFYDDVIAPSAEERAAWAALGFDPLRDCLRPVGVDTPFGEAGYDTLERKWARPTCDVNGLYGGYMGQGAKTVIPSFAGAKVSFRLAYRQDPQRVGDAFVAWLEAQEVGGCRWRITDLGRSAPVMVATDSPHVRAAKAAILRTTGRRAVMAREGATIPVIADFKATLGMDSLLIGFGLHDDALHAPNEKFDLACFDLGCRTYASLLWELGEGH
jgi:acetylornithine deacetylase/succinyl-diaminopimelate desuccinylase-like protein